MEIENGPLLSLVEKYLDRDPHAAAQSLETMEPAEAVAVVKSLPTELARVVFDHMNDLFAAMVLSRLPETQAREIVHAVEPDRAASIYMQLPSEQRRAFLQAFSRRQRKEIREFLAYPENSAGRIMSTRFLAFPESLTVKQAIVRLRRWRGQQMPLSYMYVVNQQNQLIGIMNTWDMLQAEPDTPLATLMRREVFRVNCFMDREQIANEVSSRHFFAVPVVDNENRLIGVIRAEDLIEDVQEEASEDIQKMFGAGGDEKAFSPFAFSLKHRLPWLHVNLATAFMAAAVVGTFQDLIAKITVLAVFLPVVAGQGGNAGAQSLAVVMRGLVMRDIPKPRYTALVLKEAALGAINGLVIGLVTGLIAWGWQGNPYLGIVIGLGMVVNLIVAGFSGAAIPLVMKSIGLDPAQCSNIILTTITDVLGFLAFLGFALLFQNQLMP